MIKFFPYLKSKIFSPVAILALAVSTVSTQAQSVTETAREIPIAYDVDVVVIGGTVRGVAAAEEAAKNGASVFLAAPRPYLGEDMCGTYRLWLDEGVSPESELGRALFPFKKKTSSARAIKFSYTADKPSSDSHKDSKVPSLLIDGKYGSAATESVQYDSDVSIVTDFGSVKEVDSAYLLTYQRPKDFTVGKITVYVSNDKSDWQKKKVLKNPSINQGRFEGNPLEIGVELGVKTRYVRFDVEIAKDSTRLLLAEIILNSKIKIDQNQQDKTRLVTTPMQVKTALDRALLNAKVDFLYGSYVTEIIKDSQGNPAGIVMANRSGRQAVRAKVIIDATERGVAARLAGAKFSEYPSGMQKFSRIVLEGTKGETAKDLGITYSAKSSKASYKVFEHTLELSMKDGSWASFAKADQEARNRTWQTGQVASAEMLYQVPPDSLKAKSSQDGAWESAAKINLDTLRPADVNYIYVLGGCAAVSREAAEELMKPLQGVELGKLVGSAAATEAKSRQLEELSKLTVVRPKDSNAIEAEIGEILHGLRSQPDLGKIKYIKSAEGSLPIIGKYDTVVVGGGTGGAPAGVGAARGGAKTLVLEYLHGLGGVGTLGRISKYYHGNRVGFTAEVDKGVVSLAKNYNARDGWNIEAKMEWLRSEIVKAGGDVWFRTLGAGSVVIDKKFVGVVVVTPHGRGVVIANTVIDATGNAVIPACAKLETQAITGEHISVQGTGLPPFTPGKSYKNSDWTFTDDDDVLDMWRIHVVGRQKYAGAFDQGQLIDTRARRRIVGDVTVSPMDIINHRVYPDIITVSKSNFDNHGFSSHSLFMITPPHKKGLTGNVPYRALLPKGYDGILVTGLGMSAHGDAMPVMRMQPDVQNQGYAAGKASAMAAENGTTVRNIDIKELQKHLVEQDIIPAKYVGAKDSYPVADSLLKEAVKSVGKDYSGIALVLSDLDRSKPMLQKAYKESSDEDVKLRYAHVLGMIYDGTGAETLIKAIAKAKWDKGWNFRGMGQFGATTSPLDNLIIALGRTKDKSGLPVVIQKLTELTPKSEFSHSRAVSIALENYEASEAAKHLADMLKKPGVGGHSFLEINNVLKRSPKSMVDNSTRNNSLRELILARALYRCGDYEGLGEKTLKAYANDYRGHYATHAKAILKEGK